MTHVETLLQNIDSLSPLSLGVVFVAGVLVGIAPSSFPLLAVAAGLGSTDTADQSGQNRIRGLWLSIGFALGIAVVDTALGALFGLVGIAVLRILNTAMPYVYGTLALALALSGLALWRVLRLPIRLLHAKPRPARTFAGAFALGVPFGLSTCPACTPLLLPVVVAASSTADPVLGAVLMGTFGVARGIPLVLAATAFASLVRSERNRRLVRLAEKIGGALLLAAAAYFGWQAALYAGLLV